MANYFGANFEVPFLAVEDLTSRQYYPVTTGCDSSGNLGVASAVTGCNPMPVGVLTNDPSAGQEAAVVVFGFTKARARCAGGCWLEWGTMLRCASDGFEPIVTVGSELMCGRWFGARNVTADASIIGNVFVNFTNGCATSAS